MSPQMQPHAPALHLISMRVEHRSGKDDWETPDELIRQLEDEFGTFMYDPAASEENAKTVVFSTPKGTFAGDVRMNKDNGLETNWATYGPLVWCNPPYSQWQKWVKKAFLERSNGATTVMLLPARTDTVAFHSYIWDSYLHQPMQGVEIRFVRGRIRFKGATSGAPFPSMIVVFKGMKDEN